MESFHEAWDLICDYCKAHITDVAYKTWISRIEPVKLDFDFLTLSKHFPSISCFLLLRMKNGYAAFGISV